MEIETQSNKEAEEKFTELMEQVFKFTLSKTPISFRNNKLKYLIYLDEVSSTHETESISLDILEHALFERLLLEDPQSKLISAKIGVLHPEEETIQSECLIYLFNCYKNLILIQKSRVNKNEFKDVMELIIRNTCTALQQPEFYSTQDLTQQLISLMEYGSDSSEELIPFLKDLTSALNKEDNTSTNELLRNTFKPIFEKLLKDFEVATPLLLPIVSLNILYTFSRVPLLVTIIIQYSEPTTDRHNDNIYGKTLLGSLLSISCVPNDPVNTSDYFSISDLADEGKSVTMALWSGLKNLNDRAHEIFLWFLKSPTNRQETLRWIGEMLEYYSKRTNLLSVESSLMSFYSDGICINTCAVLLRLCLPFITKFNDLKLLKIDPTYCVRQINTVQEMDEYGIHLRKLDTLTPLIPTENNTWRPLSQGSFAFITECFYMTHRAFEISITMSLERLLRMNETIATARDMIMSSDNDIQLMEAIKARIKDVLTRYWALKAGVLEVSLVALMGDLISATSVWLLQVLMDDSVNEQRANFCPIQFKQVTFPLNDPPATLRCIPELLLENMCTYFSMLTKFHPTAVENYKYDKLEPIFTLLIILMGSKERVYNPHLRAKLAECVESLTPVKSVYEMESEIVTDSQFEVRRQLFLEHPHRCKLIPSLLEVFVGIEMTGESVQFEQKFNYRRPMYTIMEFAWTLPEQRAIFGMLAKEAEENMEAISPPLFLRFINILINDAVFLLDEALTNMARLRQLEREMEAHTARDNVALEREMRQVGRIARFDNILSRYTIVTLSRLTEEIKTIFCHSAIVERVTAMLNYFLLHLVGPNKRKLQVKDKKEYKFDPAELVRGICGIYRNLGTNEEFLSAISRDGRSYSPELFQQAEVVLSRIGANELGVELLKIGKNVQNIANIMISEEELLSDIPDEFLDPIMSTLIKDPVTLPSSRITLDRATIARHLLSDQTDPFNRSPLTMAMVKPNEELKKQINDWIKSKKEGRENIEHKN